jgi:hypothetical protein
MKVESQAGKFILSFERMEPGEGALVITGRMGVWEATTTMGLGEMLSILKMTLRPRVLGYLIKALFTGGFRDRPEGEA